MQFKKHKLVSTFLFKVQHNKVVHLETNKDKVAGGTHYNITIRISNKLGLSYARLTLRPA